MGKQLFYSFLLIFCLWRSSFSLEPNEPKLEQASTSSSSNSSASCEVVMTGESSGVLDEHKDATLEDAASCVASTSNDSTSNAPPLSTGNAAEPTLVLVVGASGSTGKQVVRQLLLLQQTQNSLGVKAIVRSQARFLESLESTSATASLENGSLVITEASLLEDLDEAQLLEQVQNVDAVISCLGHNMNAKGIFGKPHRLVRDATQRLVEALAKSSKKKKKFVLMGSDGVAHPAGTDPPRPWHEKLILLLLRKFLPPHADNEEAAEYLYQYTYGKSGSSGTSGGNDDGVEWVVLRPTDLVDEEEDDGDDDGGDDGTDTTSSGYVLHDKPLGSLFGSGTATRTNVAKAMVDLITNDSMWDQYKFQMPVLSDRVPLSKRKTKKKANKQK